MKSQSPADCRIALGVPPGSAARCCCCRTWPAAAADSESNADIAAVPVAADCSAEEMGSAWRRPDAPTGALPASPSCWHLPWGLFCLLQNSFLSGGCCFQPAYSPSQCAVNLVPFLILDYRRQKMNGGGIQMLELCLFIYLSFTVCACKYTIQQGANDVSNEKAQSTKQRPLVKRQKKGASDTSSRKHSQLFYVLLGY